MSVHGEIRTRTDLTPVLSDADLDRATDAEVRVAYRILHDHLRSALDAITTTRAADLADPSTPDYLSDAELLAWADRCGVYMESAKTSYLRLIVDEVRDRRSAEALFTEVDRQFQDLDCDACSERVAPCPAHAALAHQWRSARAALCDLARIHRNYLRSLNAPESGDLR